MRMILIASFLAFTLLPNGVLAQAFALACGQSTCSGAQAENPGIAGGMATQACMEANNAPTCQLLHSWVGEGGLIGISCQRPGEDPRAFAQFSRSADEARRRLSILVARGGYSLESCRELFEFFPSTRDTQTPDLET